MANGVRHDPTATSGSYRQLDEKELDGFRGLLDRGLKQQARPPETVESMYDAKRGEVLGCRDQNTLNDLVNAVESLPQLPPNGDVPNRPVIVFDRATLRRLIIVGGTVATFHNGTPCLLRLAALMDRALSRDLYNTFRNEFFDLLEVLIGIGDEIIARTRRPYKFFADTQVNPKLDPRVLLIEPLANYHWWKTLRDARSRKAIIADPIPIEETSFKVEDEQGWQQTLDEIERNLEATSADVAIKVASVGDAPVIYGAVENLRQLKFADIERQSRARFPRWWHDYTVLDHVGLIIYHSVYSVVLDPSGNPLRLGGIAPHSLLMPNPGDNLQRNFHPPGLYLSVGPLADYQFAVAGKKVKNLLFGGITGFTRTQSTFKFEHYLQERLRDYIKGRSIHAVAAITVQEAFGTPDLSLSAIKRAMPGLIEETARYALLELSRRLQGLLTNYEEVLKSAGEQIIRGIIEQKIREWCTEWLIKKIGKRIIPVVNMVSAIASVFDDEENEMIRALIACVIMATKSRRRDDLTIAAKITANIAVDKVYEKVIAELVRLGGKLTGKSRKPADQEAPDEPKTPPPDEPAATKPAATPDPAQSAKPTAQAPSTAGQQRPKPVTQQQVVEEMHLAQQAENLQKAGAKPEAKPQPKPDEPKPKPSEPKQDAKPEAKPETAPAATQKPPSQPQRWQHQQVQQQQTKRPDPAEADVTNTATQDKGSHDKGKDPVADEQAATAPAKQQTAQPVKQKAAGPETVELQPGVQRRRGGEKKPEAPPPRKDEPEQKATRGEDIDDTRRALTQRGAKDDRAIDPNIHPSQSRPESVQAARQAGVPADVTDSGYVMTAADVPHVVPDRPIPPGKPAPQRIPTQGRVVSASDVQNLEMRADLRLTQKALEDSGARVVEVRIDQQQTGPGGSHAGTNRPDVQLVIVQAELPDGRRVHIEYDRSPPTRAMEHAERILANDPNAIVILKVSDFEPRGRPRRRDDDDEPPPTPAAPAAAAGGS